MAYEIVFSFRDKIAIGKYADDLKEMKKTIGKVSEDVPLEVVANKVFSQLARRDILVEDVTIFEYRRKKISFKETKDGIIIKNKKFVPGFESLQIEEEKEEPVKVDEKSNMPLRWEIFDPDTSLADMLQKRFKLTTNKKYPIWQENSTIEKVNIPGAGLTTMPSLKYEITNDQGEKINVEQIHFTPVQKGLIGVNPENAPQQPAPQLSYIEANSVPDMPVLR